MFQYLFLHPASLCSLVHFTLVIVLSVRIIMRRPPTGTALAWIVLIVALPFVGAFIYMLIGERRISRTRTERILHLDEQMRLLDQSPAIVTTQRDDRPDSVARGLGRLGDLLAGSPVVHGSQFEIFSDTEATLQAIAADIDSASRSVLMEFYIWNQGGAADEVLNALIRAAGRGVSCRVLVDALGGRPWWKGKQPGQLRDAGVDVRPALPVSPLRQLFGRADLRLHRKIVVIDDQVAWTGSMNLVDPRFFKQDAGVGQWVDAMVRLQGSAVTPLAMTMLGDWAIETGEAMDSVIRQTGLRPPPPVGQADLQVIPSGPGQGADAILLMILGLVNAAQKRITLTTPYLVPDESLVRALRGAAGRGVQVQLILPERVDSLLTRYASRSYYDDLLETNVEIYLYRDGLLHTKSIVVDDSLSMFGTVNLDMRSFWLNYEVALFIYDSEFARQLHELHETYLADSSRLDETEWASRPRRSRFLENSMRLFSPLL